MLMFHAELSFAPGGFVGVDVFFVISGFLITRLLVYEAETRGTIDLLRFYAFRAKRLLPLAATVLVAVIVLSALLLTPAENGNVASTVTSAALYVVNWHFVSESLNYFAVGYETSPVQHYWTLSIEEQFYIVWPLALLGLMWVFRKRGHSVRSGALATAIIVAAASLAYSFYFSFESPAQAYFSTFTRCWAMAAGAIVALVPIPKLDVRLASVLGFLGLGGIALGTFAFTTLTPYPGLATLAPGLGSVLVIIGGTAAAGALSSRVLAISPLRFMGRISYSWYLWHWPALVFGGAALGPLSLGQRLALIIGSLAPAYATHRLIEEPFRQAKALKAFPRRALAVGATCTATALIGAFALANLRSSLPTESPGEVEGALALAEQPTPQRVANKLTPSPLEAGEDKSAVQTDNCLVKLEETRSGECTYGDPNAKGTVVLFGDSLAAQYFPPLDKLAKKRGWRLVVLTKMGCSPANVSVWNHRLEREYDECADWREDALKRIEEKEKPELILISGRISTPVMENGEQLPQEEGLAAMEEGYVEVLKRLRNTGSEVAVIRDLPPSPRNVPNCVSEFLDKLDACTFRPDRPHIEAPDNRAAARVKGVNLIDLTPIVCPKGICRAVIGDALVFRDYDHLTPTFAATLAPAIEERLPDDVG